MIFLFTLGDTMALKTYGIICTKGGVGKTTNCANLGAILADMDQRVLLIDADPQQSLTRYFPLDVEAGNGLIQIPLVFAFLHINSTP